MQKSKIIGIICILLVFGLFGHWVMTKENRLIALHNRQLQQAMAAIDTSQKTTTLDTVVPFDWDKVYTFPPYTTKAEIEQTIGCTSNAISETVSEGMIQLIFLYDDGVTASICDYPQNLGYQILFDDMIVFGENTIFSISQTGDIGTLKQQP